jgi:hypothetical protein
MFQVTNTALKLGARKPRCHASVVELDRETGCKRVWPFSHHNPDLQPACQLDPLTAPQRQLAGWLVLKTSPLLTMLLFLFHISISSTK